MSKFWRKMVVGAAVLAASPGIASARTWTIETVPAPTPASSSTLDAVSCPATTTCMAVGTWEGPSTEPPGYTDQPFVERWDGTSWTEQDMPAPAGANNVVMTGISCPSSAACTAVGYTEVINGTPPPCALGGDCGPAQPPPTWNYTAFAEHWNGTGWTVQTVPNPSSQTQLLGVTCTSALDCTAVGQYSGDVLTPLAERWTGGAWSTLGQPTPGGSFAGVSCPADAACFAVGQNGGAFAEEGGGAGGWVPQVTPNPDSSSAAGASPYLTGVSCPSTTVCTAVGNSDTLGAGGYFTGAAFAEQRGSGGAVWSTQAIDNPPGASDMQLASVSCQSHTECTAVGGYFTAPNNSEYTAATRWNGTSWSDEQPPNPPVTVGSRLQSVACVTAASCIAVGESGSGPNGTAQPLVEQSS